MRVYRQPLSEAFVYGSPERPVAGSYRWVVGRTLLKSPMRLTSREVCDASKRRR